MVSGQQKTNDRILIGPVRTQWVAWSKRKHMCIERIEENILLLAFQKKCKLVMVLAL